MKVIDIMFAGGKYEMKLLAIRRLKSEADEKLDSKFRVAFYNTNKSIKEPRSTDSNDS